MEFQNSYQNSWKNVFWPEKPEGIWILLESFWKPFGILLQSNFSNQNFVRGADGSRILTGIPLTFKIFEKMNYFISLFFPPWNPIKSNLLNIYFRVMMEIVLITNPWPVASILFENWVRNLWLSICATLPGKGPSLYYVSTFLDFFWPNHPIPLLT